MWRGSMTFETPMLFALAFIVLFTIGGFSGLMLGIVPADFQYHDTYFVVAHFHYVLVTGSVFAVFAGAYYWLPKWTRSEEHTSELQSRGHLVCRLLLEKKTKNPKDTNR